MGFKTIIALIVVCGLALGAAAGAVASRGSGAAPAQVAPGVQAAGPGASSGQQQGSSSGQPQGANAAQGQQAPQAQGGQRGAVAGTIENIEGNVLTVKLPNGNSVRVTVNDDTNIRRTVPATLSDLAAGQNITIAGERGADGALTAAAVQVLPEGQQPGQAATAREPGQVPGAPGSAEQGQSGRRQGRTPGQQGQPQGGQ